MEKFDDGGCSLEWSTIDSPCRGKVHACIEPLKVVHHLFDSTCLVHRVEPDVHLHFRLCGDHVWPRSTTYHPDVEARAGPRIIQRMQALGLSRELQNGAGALFR